MVWAFCLFLCHSILPGWRTDYLKYATRRYLKVLQNTHWAWAMTSLYSRDLFPMSKWCTLLFFMLKISILLTFSIPFLGCDLWEFKGTSKIAIKNISQKIGNFKFPLFFFNLVRSSNSRSYSLVGARSEVNVGSFPKVIYLIYLFTCAWQRIQHTLAQFFLFLLKTLGHSLSVFVWNCQNRRW